MNPIEACNVTHAYGRTEALHDLSVQVGEGRVFALLGANGAGKTTAIHLIMNLLRPTRGTIHTLGVDSRRLSPVQLQKIGYVSENQNLPDWMTVRQFLDYCRGFYSSWDRDLERRLLGQFDLPADRPLKRLSRGMRMKAALLSSLAYRPKLVVLDEPFSGLDALVREEFVHGILEVVGTADWTVLISTHDIEEVERLADTVGFLDAGRLRFAEPTEGLLGRFRRVEVTLPTGISDLGTAPPGVLEWASEGSRIRYVDPAFSSEQKGRRLSPQLSGAAIQAHPMTLREIFIALARDARSASKGTS